jgi:hypothetical protein
MRVALARADMTVERKREMLMGPEFRRMTGAIASTWSRRLFQFSRDPTPRSASLLPPRQSRPTLTFSYTRQAYLRSLALAIVGDLFHYKPHRFVPIDVPDPLFFHPCPDGWQLSRTLHNL